jgi:hypothetical protein
MQKVKLQKIKQQKSKFAMAKSTGAVVVFYF